MSYNIYILDPVYWNVWLAGQRDDSDHVLRSVKNWALINSADLCFNLGVFDMRTGASYTFVSGPKILTDPSGAYDRTIGGKSDILDINTFNRCKGYSNGIKNGQVLVNAPMGGSAVRNGVGITTSGKVVVAQSTSKVSEKTFASAVNNFVAKRGEVVKLFVLQDGGGSTNEYSGLSKLAFHATGEDRKVATVLCARKISLPPITRTLKLWSKGEDVKILQTVLGGIEADGSFGFGTRSRLMAAQRALGLAADGICGPLTRAALKL